MKKEREKGIRSGLQSIFSDIVRGMDFSKDGKFKIGLIFQELENRVKLNSPASVSVENMMREIDFLALEHKALSALIEKIRKDQDPAVVEEFKDRRIRERKPILNFLKTL